MRWTVLSLAVFSAMAGFAMPLGLRTAAWGVAPASRQAAVEAVFPALDGEATASDVAWVLDGTADGAIADNITDVDEYATFRGWAKQVGAAAVKASCTAWLSYALGADRLIEEEITSNDVHIVTFKVGNRGGSGTLGTTPSFTLEIAIDGVNIGGGTVTESVLKANLKKILGVEGAATLTPGAFSPDNIDITFDTPVDGKARFTAKPPADAGNTYFLRVKVK